MQSEEKMDHYDFHLDISGLLSTVTAVTKKLFPTPAPPPKNI